MTVLSSKTEFQELLQLAPDWQAVYESVVANFAAERKAPPTAFDLFERLGAKSIYLKALSMSGDQRIRLAVLIRDSYYQPLLTKMATSNQNLRRFWSQRRVPPDLQKSQAMSFAVELAQKMDGVLAKHLNQGSEDGFKVLLPAYVQRSVHNAVIDHIRQEWEWEHSTLQDLNLDPEGEDPRQNTADDPMYAPENRAINNEQVAHLNQLRQQLNQLLGNKQVAQEPLYVVDCMFGLGLSEYSASGVEMTMREVCDKLNLPGETQARRIARCQVLLDKGMDIIRHMVREKLPQVAESWQAEVNVNTASRRELTHYLGLTEGEVEKVIASRQYYLLKQLVERGAVKGPRIAEIETKGAVAAFVPIDVNSATTRDIIDILGLGKDHAQKVVAERPFEKLTDLLNKRLLDQKTFDLLVGRGAVLRVKAANASRVDLNRAQAEEITALGLSPELTQKLTRARPFATWAELEEFLSCDSQTWALLRQKFCLGLIPG